MVAMPGTDHRERLHALRAAPGHIVTIEWDAEGRRVYRDTRSWLGLWVATRIGQVTGEGQTLCARDAEYVNQEIAAGGFAGPFDYGEDLCVRRQYRPELRNRGGPGTFAARVGASDR